MKKGLFIFLLFILSSFRHDIVVVSFGGSNINNLKSHTAAFEATPDYSAETDQTLNKSNSITKIPVYSAIPTDEITTIENFMLKVPKYAEILFKKIRILSVVIIDYCVPPIDCLILDCAEYILCCNFRI